MRVACFFVALALLVTLIACDSGIAEFVEKPPASTQDPPLYPGARQITTQSVIHYGGSAKQIAFDTNDTPEAVLDFYETTLAKDGWVISDLPTQPPYQHRFLWARYDRNPSYELDLRVSPITAGQTHVEITLIEDLGR